MGDDRGAVVYRSYPGLGVQVIVGKEWWMTPDWGLGIAGELTLASMKDRNDPSTSWNGGGFGVLFSATYN